MSEGETQVLASSRWHVLIRSPESYTLWATTEFDEIIVAEFPPNEEGADAAWTAFEVSRRADRLGAGLPSLAKVTVACAILWLVVNAVYLFLLAAFSTQLLEEGGDWLTWLGAAEPLASSLFFVSLGVYVVLWLNLRSRRRGRT